MSWPRDFLRSLAAALAVGCAFVAPDGRASAEDSTPPTPAPKPPDKPDPPSRPPRAPKSKEPTYVGIRFEKDFAAGLRRSVAEGRPVYVCVNAQDEKEGGNRMLFGLYPRKELGDATREWVCVVANEATHETKTVDGDEVCGRYLSGSCQAHLDCLTWVLKRFGDGLISPSHAVIDPDGQVAFHGEYMQSALGAADLDRWLIRLSPRLAIRRAWSAREEKTDALGKTKTEELEAAAKAWVDSKDPWAAPALVAMADQETDATRKKALILALRQAGPDAAPVLFDAADGASASLDTDELATTWISVAVACDPALGAWAVGRAIFRSKLPTTDADHPGPGLPGFIANLDDHDPRFRASALEALVLRGKTEALAAFGKAADAAGLPGERIERAKAKAGQRTPRKLDALGALPRDERRRAWMLATPDEVKAARAAAIEALKDPIDEIRVAAAIALRRAGDASGAKILLEALGDPVEQPDVRAALIEIAGEDRGESPEAWADVIRGGGK